MSDEKDEKVEKKVVAAVGKGTLHLRGFLDASIGKVRIVKRNAATGEVYEDTTHDFTDKDTDDAAHR